MKYKKKKAYLSLEPNLLELKNISQEVWWVILSAKLILKFAQMGF